MSLAITLYIAFNSQLVGLNAYASENNSENTSITKPNFPSCEDPEGQLKASYPNGTHGVPGDTTTYTGRDTVYTLSDNTLIQCLCTDQGKGIQTNWWKVSSLTENEINQLKAEGWIFVPNGSAWGLEETTYMAKNESFSCGDREGDDEDNDEDKSSQDKNDKYDNSDQGQILATATKGIGGILGLAATGNASVIYLFITVGALALVLSILLNRKDS